MNPKLIKALEHLCIVNNVSAGMLAHPLDESRTKEMLKFLKGEGVPLDSDTIYSWAMEKGWQPKSAKELADLAGKIDAGKRVVIKYPGRLGGKIMSEIKAL